MSPFFIDMHMHYSECWQTLFKRASITLRTVNIEWNLADGSLSFSFSRYPNEDISISHPQNTELHSFSSPAAKIDSVPGYRLPIQDRIDTAFYKVLAYSTYVRHFQGLHNL